MTRSPRGVKPGSRRKRAGAPGAAAPSSAGPPRGARAAWTPASLMERAEQARARAYAPYSRYRVGAALVSSDGRIFEGCNVENASFGLSICAERNAVWKAVAEGVREFEAVAVTAGPGRGASPCGACRQVLHEFAPRLWVVWRDGRGRPVKRRLERLLAAAFDFPGRKP